MAESNILSQSATFTDSFKDIRLLREFYDFTLLEEKSDLLIYQARNTADNKYYAIKKTSKVSSSIKNGYEWTAECLLKEMLNSSRNRHHNIVPCSSYGFNLSEREIWYTMPFMTSLRNTIENRKRSPSSRCKGKFKPWQLLADICAALDYVKANDQLSHNNIKPENIFFDDETQLYMLGDWTNSIKLSGLASSPSSKATGGSYLAPELVTLEKECFSAKLSFYAADMYSLGLVCLEAMGIKNELFWALNRVKQDSSYRAFVQQISAELRNISSDESLNELLISMISKDPFSRPSCFEVLQKASQQLLNSKEDSISPRESTSASPLKTNESKIKTPELKKRSASQEPSATGELDRPGLGVLKRAFSVRVEQSQPAHLAKLFEGLLHRLELMVQECDTLRKEINSKESDLLALNEERAILKTKLVEISSDSVRPVNHKLHSAPPSIKKRDAQEGSGKKLIFSEYQQKKPLFSSEDIFSSGKMYKSHSNQEEEYSISDFNEISEEKNDSDQRHSKNVFPVALKLKSTLG